MYPIERKTTSGFATNDQFGHACPNSLCRKTDRERNEDNKKKTISYLLNLSVDGDSVPLIIVEPQLGRLYVQIQSSFGQRHPDRGASVSQRHGEIIIALSCN